MFNSKHWFIIMPLMALLSCSKDENDFPVEPVINVLGISPANALEYSDKVTITIHYEDGDGDLGENKEGVTNCFVTDNRIGITYQYRIKQLAPTGSSIHITGNLNIDFGGQAITDNSASQAASFTVRIVDRAGHSSNSVNTGNITIHS
jgi:hypothetical protein